MPELQSKSENEGAENWEHGLHSWRMLKDNSGAALMMAIFTMTMLLTVSMDMLFETSVEIQVSSQAVNQVKAYYAAKAGVEIALLRIHIYKKAMSMAGSMLPNKSMLDPIWNVPFAWPPVIPGAASGADKSDIKSAVKESLMKSQYLVTIESEGSKIGINDLASPSKVVADSTKQQLMQIFASKMESDEKFASKYRGLDFGKVLNNVADWVDEDHDSRNGGDESALYANLPGSKGTSQFMPPNQPFKTLKELHMVEGINDDLYDMLESRITVFGDKGININYASKDVLMSLTPLITAEKADKIVESRTDPNRGPFKDEKEFLDFLNNKLSIPGNPFEGKDKTDQTKVPLIFDAEYNFRIHSTGVAGKVNKDIIAIVYDLDRVKERLKTLMATQSPSPTPTGTPNTAPPPAATATPAPSADAAKTPNERPNIVYWSET
jgi:general secretion pathway protein K